MGENAISVQNVSKKFRLFNSPKERLFEALHPFNKKYHKEFWALKNINFEVKKGTTIGIIGRNGAGKSTLLQILCSILRPTDGSVTVNGKISILLALGAGFNPEFSGRQNIFMNGMLSGFSREEMSMRMYDIEAFADIGEFIDQPMKIYSSGMSLRLAFSAAINVDPDILIVDEVLAVGDAKFQHKCYSKFLEFQEAGRTIIFVSHDTNAILKHCDRAILIHKGNIVKDDTPNEAVNCYVDILEERDKNCKKFDSSKTQIFSQRSCQQQETFLDKFLYEVPQSDKCIDRKNYNKNEYRQSSIKAEIIDYLVICGEKCDPTVVDSGETIEVYIKAKYNQDISKPNFGISIKTIDGFLIYAFNSFFVGINIKPARKFDIKIVKFSFKLNLSPGDFFFDLGLDEAKDTKDYISIDRRCGVIHLNVREKNLFHGIVDFEAVFKEISVNSSVRL